MTSKILDRGVIELLGPFGLSQSLYGSSTRLASADTGSIASYGLYIFVAAISLTMLLFAPVILGTFSSDAMQQLDSMFSQFGDVRMVLLYGAALFYMTGAYTPKTDTSGTTNMVAA